MKILILGEDTFTAKVLAGLAKCGHEVVLCATPEKNKKCSGLELAAKKYRVPFLRIKDANSPEFIERVRELNADLLVSVHFERLIRRELFSLPKLGAINVHPSLLPAYKGLSPQHWPIINGDAETGITVHFIDDGMDTGDIILQKSVPIPPNATIAEMQSTMLNLYAPLVCESIEKISSPEFVPAKQNTVGASYYPRLRASDLQIDLNAGKQRAFNLIRGVSFPYPGARLGNVIIWSAEFVEKEREQEVMKKHSNVGMITMGGGISVFATECFY